MQAGTHQVTAMLVTRPVLTSIPSLHTAASLQNPWTPASLFCPELLVVISEGAAGCGPAPCWWVQNDVVSLKEHRGGRE